MVVRTVPWRAVIQPAWSGARISNKFRKIADRNRRIRAEDERDIRDLRDWRQRGERIERHLHQELIDDEIGHGRNEERIAVRPRARHFLRSNITQGTWFWFDDELLSKCLLNRWSENAYDRVADAAGREGHDHAN